MSNEETNAASEALGEQQPGPRSGAKSNRQLLIYEDLAPITSERHRNWSVRTGGDYGFARRVNSVPLTAVEFREAAADFPIVFAEAGKSVVPVVLLGLRVEQNLFVDDEGKWTGRYVPAFLRRYPFVFSSMTAEAGREVFALCIDETFEGCNQEGRGERLFDADGERTQYLNSVLGFQREYQAQAMRTQSFCEKLKEHELLEPMSAKMAGAGTDQPIAVTGFHGIQRKKLHELPGDALQALSVTGELELAYLHLHSLHHFKAMFQAASKRGAGEPKPS